VIGLDTLVKVAQFVYAACPDDEARELFRIPSWLDQMVKNNWLGDKAGQGFYRKEKKEGKTFYPSLDLNLLEYSLKPKVKFATLDQLRRHDDLKQKMKIAISSTDKAGEFYRNFFFGVFQYVSNRIPEITNEIYRLDEALNAGFGWELGPFAAWDAIGLEEMMVPFALNFSTSSKICFLTSAFSITTSITQSHSAISFMLSEKFPVVISFADDCLKSAAGVDFSVDWSALFTMRFLTVG
jgi:3-hydroxyacyl-CoA dehydrogenase